MGLMLPRAKVASRAASAFLVAVALVAVAASPVLALSLGEFFSYTYTAQFSKTQVAAGESFSVTIQAQAVCSKSLPIPVPSGTITGRIVALNQATGAKVTLNPSYTLTLSPVPSTAGETTQVSRELSLQFPADSQAGAYQVSGELIEAKLMGSIDVTQYFPPTQALGTVTVTGATGGVVGGGDTSGGQATPTPAAPTSVAVPPGDVSRFLDDGRFVGNIVVQSDDSGCRLAIKTDVRGTGPDGTAMVRVDMTVEKTPAAPPANAGFASTVYQLAPGGTTFEPPVTLTMTYDRQRVPPGVDEKTLVIAYRDAGTQAWTRLPSTVEPQAQTVSAPVSHFSQFVVLATIAAPSPAPTVSPTQAAKPTVSPAPASPAKPTATPVPPQSARPEPTSVSPLPAPTATPETPVPPGWVPGWVPSWTLVVIALVVVVAAVGIPVFLRRKGSRKTG